MPKSILKSPPIDSDDNSMAMPTPGTSSAASSPVSFNRRTRVYLIPTRAELSKEEFAAAFLSASELKEVRDRIAGDIKAIHVIDYGGGGDDDDECDEGPYFRGIEHLLSKKSIMKKLEHKFHVTSSILAAQREGADSNHIASISSRASRWAVDSALIKAAADAAFVRRVTQNNKKHVQSVPSALSLTNNGPSHRSQTLANTLNHALSTSNTCESKIKTDIRRSNSFPAHELGTPSWVTCITGVPSAAITTHAVALDLAIV